MFIYYIHCWLCVQYADEDKGMATTLSLEDAKSKQHHHLVTLHGPYKTRIGAHPHIGAFFHADRILDFKEIVYFRGPNSYTRNKQSCRYNIHHRHRVTCTAVTHRKHANIWLKTSLLGLRRVTQLTRVLNSKLESSNFQPTVLTVALMLQCASLCLSSVTLCVVAKRQQVTIESLQEVVYEKSIGTKMNDLDLCLEVISRSRQPLRYQTLNISETVRDRGLVPKDYQQEMAYGLSNGHVTDDVT